MNTFTSRLFHLGAMPYRAPTFRVDPGGRVVKVYRPAPQGPVSELPVTFSRAADSIFRTWATIQHIYAERIFFAGHQAARWPAFWNNGPVVQENPC